MKTDSADDIDVEIDLQEPVVNSVPDNLNDVLKSTRKRNRRAHARQERPSYWTDDVHGSLNRRVSDNSSNRNTWPIFSNVRNSYYTRDSSTRVTATESNKLSKGWFTFIILLVGIAGGIVGGAYGNSIFEHVKPHYTDDLWNNFTEFVLAEGWNSFGWLGTLLMWFAIGFTISAGAIFAVLRILFVIKP